MGGVNSRFQFLFTFHLIFRQLSATAQRSAESILHIPFAILKRGEYGSLCTGNTNNPNTQSTNYSITNMKKRLFTCIALCSVMLSAMAQASYTFNAVALNVDGLPEKISVVTINSGGPLSEGTKTLSSQIAQKDWGFVGLSEDFNFHTELMSSISHLYNSGTHRGKVEDTSNDTDGLGLLCAKWYSFSNESWTRWNVSDGNLMGNLTEDNGADELIDKGYRYYKITIASGFDIDVYVLHMDAASRQDDIAARESQLKQLATAVKTNTGNNKRPAIILGDTNCRYTREKLKELLIDEINKDSRFTIKDAWIEHMWDGVYPTYGGESMMTHTYGAQKGEVVDKVFYINTTESNLTLKANSYLHDTSIAVSDHYPVVVNFTLTDPNGAPVEAEFPGPDGEVVLTDGNPTDPTVDLSGKTYYLRNTLSGLYLKAARGYGAQASEGVHALPITFNKLSSNTYYITSTIPERDGLPVYLGSDLYFDNQDYATWTLKEIVRSDGVKKYMLVLNGNAVASEGNGIGVTFAAENAADTKQHWILYTDDMIKKEMPETVSGTTYNASTLIPYGRVDTHHSDTRKPNWQGSPSFSGWSDHANHTMEIHSWGGDSEKFDVYQNITGLPAGTYTLTAQAFHREGDSGTSNIYPELYATNGNNKTVTTKVCSINDASAPATKPNSMHEAGDAFLNGSYNVTLSSVTVDNDGKLRIGVRNTAVHNSRMWCCFNNFQLLYHGTAQGDLKGTELYRSVKAAAEEAQALIATQSAEVQAAFDISNVAYRYNNNLISADGAWELAAIDNAVRTAVKSQTSKGADMSLAIVNNSFETGDLTGWTVFQNGWDTGANAIQNAAGMDGKYLFNTWTGDTYGCGIIYQDVTGLRNGHYTLQAMVTSWADRKAYIVANNRHVGVATTAGEGTFIDLSLDFLVEDGTARIGAVGGHENGDFNYKMGIFYKADNFRLTYMGSTGEGRVKIALADAKAKAAVLHDAAKAQFNAAVAQYENGTVTGNGTAEETAIYDALKAAIATQPRTETDMTWMINNPSFETGDWTGWTTVIGWDTQVLHVTHQNATTLADGQYVVNTWNDNADATNSGVNAPVYQALSSLPNGRYRLTADVTSDGGNQVTAYATVDGQTTSAAVSPENNATFMTSSVEFEVTGNADVTIGAVGLRNGEFNAEGGCWYKCDNFRLTYLGHDLALNETEGTGDINDWYTSVNVDRTIKAGKWNTFVVPFNMAIPEGWEVKALTGSQLNGDNITLEFGDATSIEAGVAYMVRCTEEVSTIDQTNLMVNTTLNNPATNDVEFIGTYANGNIPAGSFFISNNVFYQAADATNTIKAFRAYFTPKVAGARSMSYRIEGSTGIDTTAEEVTVVGIYTLGGMRINDMQQGINILHMSDGTTMKVIIR